MLDASTGAPLPKDDALPAVAEELRRAVLPDAVSRAQQELEAGLVAAASKAIRALHRYPKPSLCRPATIFKAAIPDADHVRLVLEPIALGPLLSALLPQHIDDEVYGVVGLRYRVRRRSIELFLVDHPHTTGVTLTGLTRRELRAALAYVTADLDDNEHPTWIGEVFPHRLSPAERLDLEQYGRVFGPAHLMSGLLRRIGVLRGALWMRTWNSGCDSLPVEWPEPSPEHVEVATKLTHPIVGLPGGRTLATVTYGRLRRLHQPDGPLCPRHNNTNCGPVEIVFRSAEAPTPEGDRELQKWSPGAVSPAWSAWAATLQELDESPEHRLAAVPRIRLN
ncbi:MAG: hypothetical protein M3443_04695 [Actinomycetota bacterium]|nr:hypothetical protein [Actinomycetota bacterium]